MSQFSFFFRAMGSCQVNLRVIYPPRSSLRDVFARFIFRSYWLQPFGFRSAINLPLPPNSYILIISDLLWGFKDPVLWFIKSLIFLYGSFYLSTLFLKKNKTLSLTVLWTGTVVTCIISYFSNGTFGLNSISGIPLFAVGVLTSLWSSRKLMRLHPALIALLASFIAVSFTMSFFPRFVPNLAHVIADYAVVATIIMVFYRWQPVIKIPALFSLITFDIYLVHFKVLTVMKEVTPTLPIAIFIIATILLSLSLYLLRTKLIKI